MQWRCQASYYWQQYAMFQLYVFFASWISLCYRHMFFKTSFPCSSEIYITKSIVWSRKILIICNLSTLILTIWLVYQARPTLYEVVMEMIDKMGYQVWFCFFYTLISNPICILVFPSCRSVLLQVRLVRVTRRVDEAYFAQLYLTKAFTLYSLSSLPPLKLWYKHATFTSSAYELW